MHPRRVDCSARAGLEIPARESRGSAFWCRPQIEHLGADESRAVVGDRFDRPFELCRLRRETRYDRGHEDTGVDARIHQLAHRTQALQGMRRARLERPPRIFVHRGHADAHRARCRLRHFQQRVPVAHDHRTLGHQADRRPAGGEREQRSTRQPVVSFDRLIRIGRGAECDELAAPGRSIELTRQHVGEVRLHQDDRRELITHAQLELGVIAAGEAVVATVGASAVRIERPVEGHALNAIERRAARHLLIGRGVGAALGLGQTLDPAAFTIRATSRVVGRRTPRSKSSGSVSTSLGLLSFLFRYRMMSQARPGSQCQRVGSHLTAPDWMAQSGAGDGARNLAICAASRAAGGKSGGLLG